jgi:hypothetical protein
MDSPSESPLENISRRKVVKKPLSLILWEWVPPKRRWDFPVPACPKLMTVQLNPAATQSTASCRNQKERELKPTVGCTNYGCGDLMSVPAAPPLLPEPWMAKGFDLIDQSCAREGCHTFVAPDSLLCLKGSEDLAQPRAHC